MACILLWSSAVRVHDSQAYRKMDVTRERISRVLELREILLSIQIGFSRVNAAVACAILESISGLEPSSVITKPRYLKLVTVSSFCPFTLISVLMPLVLFVLTSRLDQIQDSVKSCCLDQSLKFKIRTNSRLVPVQDSVIPRVGQVQMPVKSETL